MGEHTTYAVGRGTAYGRHSTTAIRLSVIVGVIASLLTILSPSAHAANGDNLRQITADTTGTACPNVGTGLAFDGTHLLLSCWYDSKIVAVSPTDGSQIAVHTVSGTGGGIGALAWDAGRQLLWACDLSNEGVGTINLTTDVFTPVFVSAGCIDGLAYDGADDTIWSSGDAVPTIEHYTITGTQISSTDILSKIGGSCGNSGIAVGGPKLYLANNGCSEIYEVSKDLTTSTLFASFPARLEDLECDDVTFAGQNVGAIWSKDAYDNVLNAWSIPEGLCTSGGGRQGTISIGNGKVFEGDAGTRLVRFPVTLSAASASPVTVDYRTVNGVDGVAPADYTAKTGTLTFPAGVTSQQVSVSVNGNTINEGTEFFKVKLSNPQGAALSDDTGTAAIIGDDPGPAAPHLTVGSASVYEGEDGSSVHVMVTLSKASASPVSVSFATANGSAAAPGDYTAASGTLTFSPGQTTKAVTVPIVGDTTPEGTETFTVQLSGASGAAITNATGTVKILNGI